jgi:hypothetical protein
MLKLRPRSERVAYLADSLLQSILQLLAEGLSVHSVNYRAGEAGDSTGWAGMRLQGGHVLPADGYLKDSAEAL